MEREMSYREEKETKGAAESYSQSGSSNVSPTKY